MDFELICIGLFALCGCLFFILFLAWFRGGRPQHHEGRRVEGVGKHSATEDQSSMAMSSGDIDHAGNLTLSSLACHSGSYFVKRLSRSLTAERSALIMPSIVREFSFEQMEAATGKFSSENIIRQGHSGDIYKGVLEGGEVVIIKRICLRPTDIDMNGTCHGLINRDSYFAEMDIYGKVLDQSFLVPVLGQCLASEAEKFLVYEHMLYGDLASVLAKGRAYHDSLKSSPKTGQGESEGEEDSIKFEQGDDPFEAVCRLTWPQRMKIAREVAQALVYLHHESRPPLSHRNIQGSSILLNKDLEVKLGSLGDAQKIESGELPAYDIYCFGRLLLDIISGLDISGMRCTRDEEAQAWISKCFSAITRNSSNNIRDYHLLVGLVDKDLLLPEQPPMDKDHLLQEISQVAQLAKLCMEPTTLQKLSMKKVLHLLHSNTCH